MKYEIFKYREKWDDIECYAIVKRSMFVRRILTKDGKWVTLGQANAYTNLFAPRSFPTVEDAKKYSLNMDNSKFGMFEKVSDEEIALKELKQ